VGPSQRCQRRRTGDKDVRRTECTANCRGGAGIRAGFKAVVIVALIDNVIPTGERLRWIDPGFQSHTGCQAQSWRIRNGDDGARAIEYYRLSIFAVVGPASIRDGTVVTASSEIVGGCAGTFIEGVSCDQTGNRSGCRRSGLI